MRKNLKLPLSKLAPIASCETMESLSSSGSLDGSPDHDIENNQSFVNNIAAPSRELLKQEKMKTFDNHNILPIAEKAFNNSESDYRVCQKIEEDCVSVSSSTSSLSSLASVSIE
jgi:hypothetical protein